MELRLSRSEWTRVLDENLATILAAIRGTDIEEVEVESGDELIRVRIAPELARRDPAGTVGVVVEAAGPVGVPADRVGTFFRALEEGEQPLINEGDAVAAGDTIGYVDSLQVYHVLKAPKDGTVLRFLVEDGEDVEYGELIATIEPGGGAVEEEAAGPGAAPGAIRL